MEILIRSSAHVVKTGGQRGNGQVARGWPGKTGANKFILVVGSVYKLHWVFFSFFDHYYKFSSDILFGASMYLLRLMLVGVWLGLLWVLFYFFDHYIPSSDIQSSVQFGFFLRSLYSKFGKFSSVIIQSHLSGSIYTLRFDISVTATHDARGDLPFDSFWVLFSFFDHYIQSSVRSVCVCVCVCVANQANSNHCMQCCVANTMWNSAAPWVKNGRVEFGCQ